MWLRRVASRRSTSTRAETVSPDFQTPFLDFDLVNDQPLRGRIRIDDRRAHAFADKHADIPDLPAALGVKRRVMQDDLALFARAQRLNFSIVLEQREDFRVVNMRLFVTLELGTRIGARGKLKVHGLDFGFAFNLLIRSGLLQFAQRQIELRVECFFIDRQQPALFQTHANQIARRAKGVVNPRQFFPVGVLPLFKRRKERFDLLQADHERRTKAFLFEFDDALDEAALRFEFGIGIAHLVNDKVCDLVEKQFVEAERVATVIDGAAHDFAQDVVAPRVAGQDAIGD